MNKVKTFFSAVLLSQVVINTATPVLANPYNYEQYNRRYDNTLSSTERVENNTSPFLGRQPSEKPFENEPSKLRG